VGTEKSAMQHRAHRPDGMSEKVRKLLPENRRTYRHNAPTMSIDHIDFQREGGKGMNPRICICCGEPMAVRGEALSRNPNICASCSSILDGMDESKNDQLKKPTDKPEALSMARESTVKLLRRRDAVTPRKVFKGIGSLSTAPLQ
jgi:hypothetical protein